MKKIYTVTAFNTKNQRLTLIVRASEKEAKEQILYEMNCLKERETVLETKLDYPPGERLSLGCNEHNGYCKTENAEYFWKTDCICETIFTIK